MRSAEPKMMICKGGRAIGKAKKLSPHFMPNHGAHVLHCHHVVVIGFLRNSVCSGWKGELMQ